jgi:hypothetical protein
MEYIIRTVHLRNVGQKYLFHICRSWRQYNIFFGLLYIYIVLEPRLWAHVGFQLYVSLISTGLGPTVLSGPLSRVLIGDAQPNDVAGGPLSRSAINRRWGPVVRVTRFTVAASTPPRNPTDQGGAASDGKLHRRRHCSTASPPIAALAQNFTNDPVMAGSSPSSPTVSTFRSLSLTLSLPLWFCELSLVHTK